MRIGAVALVAAALCAVGALALPAGDAAAADPACPASWPEQAYDGPLRKQDHARVAYQDYFTDADGGRWFVIRSSDSNGYTTIRAYPADADGAGYVANSPDEVCYLVARRPGDAEDAAAPTQVIFPAESEEPAATTSAPSGPALSGQAAIVSRLRRNADEFEYAIGKRGGSLTYTTIGDPLTFNLALATDSASSGPLGYLFEGLTETSWLTHREEPALAQSWERSEDGLTWTFHLRRDARWHDGAPFTAHDVAFTFNRIIYNESIPAPARANFNFRFFDRDAGQWRNAPMTVTALDDHTVQCVLPAPLATFLHEMGAPIYPKHILERYVDAGAFNTVWGISADPAEVIGTGPFTIAGYEPGKRLTLRRNPDYWLKDAAGNRLPYLDEIVRDIVPNVAAQLPRFRAGESDVHGVLGEEFAGLAPLQAAENFSMHRRGPGFGTTFLSFNVNPGRNPDTGARYVAPEKLEWFRNKQFRQAVAYVIDKDAIINEIQRGLAYPQWSSVSPAAGDFHNPNVRRYDYNISRANAILDGIGWQDTDGDGVREDHAGNDITFTLVTNENNSVRVAVGRLIKQGMEDAGLKVDYRPWGGATWWDA